MSPQVARESCRFVIAISRLVVQTLLDDIGQSPRDERIELTERRKLGDGIIGNGAAEGLVQECAQGVDVGAAIDRGGTGWPLGWL